MAVERLAVSVSNDVSKGKDAAVAVAASSPLSSSVEYPTNEALAVALENKDSNPTEAIALLREILDHPSSTSEVLRIKEQAIAALSDILSHEKKAEELRSLLTDLRPYFNLVPKAKSAKIVRGIIDAVAKIPGTSDLQISLCREMVEWTRSEKRMFLRQRVEARLAALLMDNKEYVEALSLLTNLVREVRRLDDKLLLVGIDCCPHCSKCHLCPSCTTRNY
jgi:26S proteasome regulatory subunit N6